MLLQDKLLQFDQAVGSTSTNIMYISIVQVDFHFLESVQIRLIYLLDHLLGYGEHFSSAVSEEFFLQKETCMIRQYNWVGHCLTHFSSIFEYSANTSS